MISKSLLIARPIPARRAAAEEERPFEITPIISETEPNNSGPGQIISRSALNVSANPKLANDDLPSITFSGSISTPGDVDYYSIDLTAGELIIIDIDGTGGSWDSFLTVLFGGSELGTNDDLVTIDPGSVAHQQYGHNTDSFISFRAPTTGTYRIGVSSFEGQSSGSYAMHVSVGPPASPEQIREENISALIGRSWAASNVTFSFPTSADQYGTSGATEIAAGFAPLLGAQMAAVGDILRLVGGLTNLTFTRLFDDPGAAQMRFARSNDPDTAHAYLPGPGNGGDSWYNMDNYNNPQTGNYPYMTFLHETGHALGLEHGHEWPSPLSPDRDSLEYSVMTYRGYVGQPPTGYRAEQWGYPQTFMMYDIAALQRMYGANFSHNSGDSVYSWMPGTGAFSINGSGTGIVAGANRVFMTIWDGGGNDTYDLSSYTTGVSINLKPGEWTTTSAVQLANLGDGNYARGNVANALLYDGDLRSLIENAIGGSGNDFIYGNQAANRLDGGLGNDLLDGDLGDDLLVFDDGGDDQGVGGGGNDVLYYGGALTVADVNDGGSGTDTLVLQGNYSLTLGNGSVTGMEGISLQSGSIMHWGQSGINSYDYVLTTIDANVVAGQQFRVNAQSLQSGEDFTFDGSAETDGGFLVYAGFGIDQLTGSNSIYGDVFFFEAGRFGQGDRINGGSGGDAVVISGVAAGQSVLSATIFSGTFQSIEAFSVNGRFASDPNARPSYDLVLEDGNIAAGGQLIVNGSSLAASQSMTFNANLVTTGSLVMFGGAGSDHFRGSANGDLIYAAGGSDLLFGGTGADIFQYRDLSDSAVDGRDVIQDFLRGTDKIDLSRIDADLDEGGDQDFTFIGESAFSGINGQLRAYSSGNGSWFVEGDVDGNGSPDFRIEVFTTDNLALASNDFVL